ncbi:MAG: gamma carbonic anhydrase family protein [Elusimicrobia bacterium]|nr:gamma carbonic anhydrase family protein [Elusimicrobiota bacterium]
MIRSFADHRPRIHPTAFIHWNAEIIGRVLIGRQASVWPMAVLRGDVDAIRLGERSNVQDCAVVHCRNGVPAVIGRGVTVGHGAIIHGARIGDLCLVGMGAIVMEAVIGRECLIGAGALVPGGFRIPPRSLVLGSPARVHRKLTSSELAHLRQSERSYVALADRHRSASRIL